MHPHREMVEKWLEYFSCLGHPARMSIESLPAREEENKKGGTSSMSRLTEYQLQTNN